MAYVEITAIEEQHERFRVRSTEESYEAKTLIIATGGRPRSANIKGEKALEGRGVSRCATCDGAFFAGKPVAVIGGGDTALDEALYLANVASAVHIVHDGDTPIASATLVARARQNPKIELIANATAEEIVGDQSVKGLRLTRHRTLEVAGVFLALGFEPETDLLKNLLQVDRMGHIPVDINMQTTLPGLFAAGSVRQGGAGQLASAAGDGVTAAIAAHRYLFADKLA